MTEFKCPKCKKIITEHIENCEDFKFLECPYCRYRAENPYYFEK